MNDSAPSPLAWLFDAESRAGIDAVDLRFGAAWAEDSPFLVGIAVIAAFLLGVWFYRRMTRLHRRRRALLGTMRGIVLGLVVLLIADAQLHIHSERVLQPRLWLLVDRSESMRLPSAGRGETSSPSRADVWKAQLARDKTLRELLAERFRVEAHAFAGPGELEAFDWKTPAIGSGDDRPVAASGTTAIGAALDELRRRGGARPPDGIVIISDFVENAGPSSVEIAREIDCPVFAVGVGPEAATDLAVALTIDPVVKQDERAVARAILRQRGLTGQTVSLRLALQPAGGDQADQARSLATRQVTLDAEQTTLELPIRPSQAGRFALTLTVDPAAGETLLENNADRRGLKVTDEFLRVLFVEYEPTWEWRFIKEVFHRDRLVGQEGFRTYLRSSDPAVRDSNDLFISALPPAREEFFTFDVILLGDMPSASLPERFCDMTREFVSDFGGGLVVMAGPRFGPQALGKTAIAGMLPVVIDPNAGRRDGPFELALTGAAERFDFMQLGDSAEENRLAWANLGELPWYQPVQRVESTAIVLAEHPEEMTAAGNRKQPLIALRRYGSAGGEVVYIGSNETWRLRRLYGDKYYRQFWAQLIHRLGLDHAQGADKRFTIDPFPEEPFAPGEEITLRVRAWDAQFKPLTEDDLARGDLPAEVMPAAAGESEAIPIALRMSRPGVFETTITLDEQGHWSFRVVDPVTQAPSQMPFTVAHRSLERREPNRDTTRQQQLAGVHKAGRACPPEELARHLAAFHPTPRVETQVAIHPLGPTWPMFALVAGLLLGEWWLRRRGNLA